MRCKDCGQPLDELDWLDFELCQMCWEKFCDMTWWEQFQLVAEGAD